MLTPGAARLSDPGLFAGLDGAEALLIAVSGGPDSMALMLLLARWATGLGTFAPRLHVATVDHGLRAEARGEAEVVGETARALGLPHTILTWTGARPTTRVQERARVARYALLGTEARRVGATILLTAHHADDQAETVLMRLGHGSGIGGLAGMRRESALEPGLTLIRPLLDVPKDDLVRLCEIQGVGTIADPSNADPTYERVRLRLRAKELETLGLGRDALTRLARRMARADAALSAETARVEAGLSPRREPGLYRARLPSDLSPEILIRLLRGAIAHVVPGAAIRLDRLETLAKALLAAQVAARPVRSTLAGARIAAERDGSLEIVPESRRNRGRVMVSAASNGSRSGPVKAELTRPPASLGKTRGAAYIA